MRGKRIAAWLQLQEADEAGSHPGEERRTRSGPSPRERIRERLEERGVSTELAETLAVQLQERATALDGEHLESLLEGVALACGLRGDADDELMRNASELREIERMMGAFAGELSKLDETLEVLSAYVRRMRTGVSEREGRVLH